MLDAVGGLVTGGCVRMLEVGRGRGRRGLRLRRCLLLLLVLLLRSRAAGSSRDEEDGAGPEGQLAVGVLGLVVGRG